MKAACYHGPKNITTEEVKKPEIGDKDILIKVDACGICGSDLHMYAQGIFREILCKKVDKREIPGHEYSGEVVETGSTVEGIEIGDRVSALSNGGMAEYVAVSPAIPNMNVYKIPAEVSFDEAATLEPLANSLHAAKLGNPAGGENAFIFGAGIIGLGVIQCLKVIAPDLNKIVMVDVSDKRLELAKKLGADDVINVKKEDLYQKVTRIAGTAPVRIAPGGLMTPAVDIVYDCVGYIKNRPEPPVIQQAILIAREFGRVVVHGTFEEPVTIEFNFLVGKHVKIYGSFGFIPGEAIEAMELMRSKKVDRESIISHTFSLDQAKEAFDTQLKVEDSVKVMVKP